MPRTADHIANRLNLYAGRCDTEFGSRMYLYQSRKKRDSEGNENYVSGAHSSTIISVVSSEDASDEPLLLTIIENANMDGTRHLHAKNPVTKYCWATIIIIFVLLACFQSFKQIKMYLTTPVATNIEAAYPDRIPFPAVAICNNNQYRLTYLTGPAIQNRKPKEPRSDSFPVNNTNLTVFDKVLENAWDMDAVKFLRNAAHWKSRMILSCTWPNGTSCRLSHFKAIWTLTGLCWAINTDPYDPHYVTSSGSTNGLKLLLNIERYERIESCTPYFRTVSLPGLKILIYNQTDMPESLRDGVNVPPGYTMEIPLRIQKRHKYPGSGCVEETGRTKKLPFDDPENIHTCSIRRYLHEIEQRCGCSMRRAYSPNSAGDNLCNVEQYFTCVLPTLQSGEKRSFDRFRCIPPCDQIDYTAWQDMTLLPNNIFPSLIDTTEEEDVEDVVDDYESENDANIIDVQRDEHFQCEENQLLSMEQVQQIKRAAQRAYEKQSRYQEDIQLRTKRLILKLREATQKLTDNGWGWTDETYRNAFKRLNESIDCFRMLPVIHAEVLAAIKSPPTPNEEARTANIYRFLEPGEDARKAKRFQTVVQLREAFGERYDEIMKQMQSFSSTVSKLSNIYNPSFYKSALAFDLKRMDIVLNLAEQYEAGRLQRRAWAEKMQSRNMRHFFDQDFFEGWYNPVMRDLDENLVRKIADMEADELPKFMASIKNGSGLQMGSMLYFGDATKQHKEQFGAFVRDIVQCTFGEVKNESVTLVNSFKKMMHEFQSAYANLYKKELPAYLANFDFGSTFVEQNFAMVNVFLHRMTVETWRQESTYSIWSLACDVGGALGLFLGASLLTVIELIYLCFTYGLCTRLFNRNVKTHPADKTVKREKRKVELENTLLNGNLERPSSRHSSLKTPSIIIREVDENDERDQFAITKSNLCDSDVLLKRTSTDSSDGDPENMEKQANYCFSMQSGNQSDNSSHISSESDSSESVNKITAALFQPKTERQTSV